MTTEMSGEFYEGKEQRKNQFPNFFQLSQAEQEDLRARIEKSQGLVRIFVHPYYDIYLPPPPGKEEDERYSERLRSGMERIFNSKNGSKIKPPVMIMEEENHLAKTQKFLENNLSVTEKILFIPTDRQYPTPLPFGEFEGETRQEFDDWFSKSWAELRERLKNLAVKKILIGGMYLWSDERGGAWTQGRKSIGCLGGAIEHLADDFKIKISSLSNPDSRKEIKELGSEFKKYL